MRQRLLIGIVCAAGTACWLWALPWLRPVDASSGITLFDAGGGFVAAVLMLGLCGLPALAGAGVVAAAGNPLAGVFTAAFALMILAAMGGGSQGFLWRNALPSGYGWLIIEAMIWLAAVVGLFLTLMHAAPRLGRLLPPTMKNEQHTARRVDFKAGGLRSLISGAIAGGIGGFLASVMIQSTTTGQIVGALLTAFLIGALIGQLIMPQSNPVVILMSPLLAGVVAYGIVLLRGYATTDEVLLREYAGQLPGAALALPLHYASAGVLGACLGVGFAQSLDHVRAAES